MSKSAFFCLILGMLLLNQGGLDAQEKEKEKAKEEPKKEEPKAKLIEGKPLEFWVAALQADEAEVRRGAARVIASARGNAKAAAPAALDMLKGDDAYNRALGAYMLQYIEADPKVTVGPLIAAVGDKDRKVREAAAFALANMKDEAAVDALGGASAALAGQLSSETADVRGLTLYVISNARKLDSKPLVAPLLEIIRNDKVPNVRKAALESLRSVFRLENKDQPPTPDTMTCLLEALKDMDPDVRRAAATTLVIFRVETRKAIPMLLDLMAKAESADVRGLAAFILGNIQPPDKEKVVEPLVKALTAEQNDGVKTQLRSAIFEIDPIKAEELGIKP